MKKLKFVNWHSDCGSKLKYHYLFFERTSDKKIWRKKLVQELLKVNDMLKEEKIKFIYIW